MPTDLASAPNSSSHAMQTEEKQLYGWFPFLKNRREALVYMKFLQSKRKGPLIENCTKCAINLCANLDLESAAVFLNERSFVVDL